MEPLLHFITEKSYVTTNEMDQIASLFLLSIRDGLGCSSAICGDICGFLKRMSVCQAHAHGRCFSITATNMFNN